VTRGFAPRLWPGVPVSRDVGVIYGAVLKLSSTTEGSDLLAAVRMNSRDRTRTRDPGIMSSGDSLENPGSPMEDAP
jgi:hypothetical protein